MYRYIVVMCMLVIVAPPIVMGSWSMAFLLGQHVEYYWISCIYIYIYTCTCTCTSLVSLLVV